MEVSLKSKEIAFVRMKTMNCYIRECSITDGKQWPLVGEGIFVKYYQLYQILNLRSILYHSTPGLQVQQVAEPEPVAEGGCLYFLSWVLCIVLRWSTLQGEGGRLSFLFLLSFVYCVTLSSCQGDAACFKEEIQTHQDVRHRTQHEEWGVPGVKSNTKHNVLFYIYISYMYHLQELQIC